MFDIEETDIPTIHAAMGDGSLSARELTLAYLGRIAESDKCTDGLNSVLEINPDALFLAGSVDNKLKKAECLGPLYGIPVLLKDNINTFDKMHTSAGSLALADNFSTDDAEIVVRLRRAGAILLGKANMTEFANFLAYDMPGGYSSRGGQVLCPYNRAVNPSGSSSGSAVAVAANLCTVSVGTETSGSILAPAQRNGIVGIKPTIGLVSRRGIVPISNTLDTAGPMARTVKDAAILLGVLAGEDERDAATIAACDRGNSDYTQFLDKDGLKGARIGICMANYDNGTDEERAAYETVKQVLLAKGAILVDGMDVQNTKSNITIMNKEFKLCLNAYLSALGQGATVRTMGDILRFNESHSELALKYGQGRMQNADKETTGALGDPEYFAAISDRENTIRAVDRLFDENDLDVMLFAAGVTNIAPFTGFPALTVPVGINKAGVPIGSYWMARRFDEGRLLRVAYAFEHATHGRKKPE